MLGFKLSDQTDMMEFVRCSADHHSIAMARGNGPTLNHMAYEVASIDGLMRGAGRMKKHGFNVEWGVGRHGPGDNVFSYFIDPNGFVVEYTAEVEQIDEATYQAHDADVLARFPDAPVPLGHGRPCRPTASRPRPTATCRSPIRKPASAAKRSWRRRWGGRRPASQPFGCSKIPQLKLSHVASRMREFAQSCQKTNGRYVMRSAPMIAGIVVGTFMQAAPASPQGLLTVRELSLGMAMEIAQGALDHCRKLNARIGVSVVDRGGHVLVTLRDDGAAHHTVELAQRKAYTAPISARPPVSSSSGSSTIRAPRGSRIRRVRSASFGGVPIKVAEETIGGVGISGAPGGPKDEALRSRKSSGSPTG